MAAKSAVKKAVKKAVKLAVTGAAKRAKSHGISNYFAMLGNPPWTAGLYLGAGFPYNPQVTPQVNP